MRNRIIAALAGLCAVFGLAQVAQAATSSCQTDKNGETTCVSLSQYTKSSSSASASGAVRVNTAAKVEGEFISATGFHPKHPTTHYIRVGTWYENSFRNRAGKIQYFKDRCGDGSPYTHPLTSGPHKGQCMFYWDSHRRVWRKPDCGNYVKFSGPLPRLTFKSVAIFKTFAQIKWNVTVKLSEAGKAYASATAKATGCYASASAWAKGSGSVNVHVYVYAKYSYKAKASGPGHVSSKQWLQAQAKVEANITVNVRATATAWCQVTPPPPPSFSCTGISATPNTQQAGELNYTFSLSAQYSNTTITGSKFTVLKSGNVIATPTSNTLSAQYTFPSTGSYTVEGQVVTSSGTTPVSSTCTTSVTISSPPPPPPPPPSHWTTVNCVPQEEITVGGSSLMPCSVLDDNGATTTLSAKSLDGNSKVTQFYCAADGSSSCAPGSNDWRVRIQGLNAGTTTVRVTATANGVSDVQDYTITVDPSNP